MAIRMKTWLVLIGLMVGCSAVAFASNITIIPITNNSFENPTLAPGSWITGIAGWDLNGVGGVYAPTSNIAPTDGTNVMWLNSGYVSQTLSTTLAAYSGYTLTVDVGQRPDFQPINYRIELLAGGTVLASDNGSLHPAAGQFLTSTLTYTSLTGDLIGQNLEIRLLNTGTQQIVFDNITLTDPPVGNVPEPASLVLLGSGLLACYRRVCSRRK